MESFDLSSEVEKAFDKNVKGHVWKKPDAEATLEKVMRGLGLHLDGDMIYEGYEKRFVATVATVEWIDDELQVKMRLRVKPALAAPELVIQ